MRFRQVYRRPDRYIHSAVPGAQGPDRFGSKTGSLRYSVPQEPGTAFRGTADRASALIQHAVTIEPFFDRASREHPDSIHTARRIFQE